MLSLDEKNRDHCALLFLATYLNGRIRSVRNLIVKTAQSLKNSGMRANPDVLGSGCRSSFLSIESPVSCPFAEMLLLSVSSLTIRSGNNNSDTVVVVGVSGDTD